MVETTDLHFTISDSRIATAPPEARGLKRDQVRLMVAGAGDMVHSTFGHLPAFLDERDLLVVNTSPTMPAAVSGKMRGRRVGLHLATLHDDGRWTVELRKADNDGPILDGVPDEVVRLPGGRLQLEEPVDGAALGAVRLWRARIDVPGGVRRLMQDHGKPIRYGYVEHVWPLGMYQTIFADQSRWPGSAEMPSAARPFTARLVQQLIAAGIRLAPIELHSGVSSQESHEPPQPERYAVPAGTAAQVNATRERGGRVVAVGTTVTRALESAVAADGAVTASGGWTDLVLGPHRPARVVDGLLTGWHPPEASHLELLKAVAGNQMVAAAYAGALQGDYLWHEFGDSCLLLPRTFRERGPYSIAA